MLHPPLPVRKEGPALSANVVFFAIAVKMTGGCLMLIPSV